MIRRAQKKTQTKIKRVQSKLTLNQKMMGKICRIKMGLKKLIK